MKRTFLVSPWTLAGSVGALGAALLLGQCAYSGPPEVGPLDPILAAPAERLETVHLRSGQTIGEILESASVGWSEQNSLLLAFREQANPRRMSEGTPITLRWFAGEERLRGVDVTLSRDETIRLTRDEGGWYSDLVRTPAWTDTLTAFGVVMDNLWNAVMENPQLADLPEGDRASVMDWMDRVFQWQVDFSRQVQTGDTYRLVLERVVRPDGTMRTGHLISAEYLNRGMPYRAIWFDPNDDGEGTFYDEDGNSVRRAFLMKPLQFRRISSVFSNNRLHPIHNIRRPHRGVDYAANSGTPVMATGDGVVIHAGNKGELGKLLEIRHPNGWVTRYGHLRGFGQGIRVGTRVRQSQTIGYVGMTGGATGPHLHYEMRRSGGEAIDPLSVDLPAGDPVPTDSWDRWHAESLARLALLDALPGPAISQLAESPAADPTQRPPVNGGD